MSDCLTPLGYRSRIADARIEKLLKAFGGLEITGPKWCGKTWTAKAHAMSGDSLTDGPSLAMAQTDPSLVLMGDEPHLVDEWQEVPAVWDAARNHIDANANRKGQLILTGSSRPKDLAMVRHSGTGRIARFRMQTMSLIEAGFAHGGVSLSGLFDGEFVPVVTSSSIQDVARWCCRGGWPSIIDLDDEFALETPSEYVKSVLEVSIPRMGSVSEVAAALMRALSLNVGQATTLKTLANDMGLDGGTSHGQNIVREYLAILDSLYMIEGLPGWAPPLRSKKRVQTKPRHYFVDPSIPASILGVSPATLLRDTQTLGCLFETLVLRDIRTFLSVMPGAANRLGYYRDDKGLEADIIIELTDGRWAAIEVKLSEEKATDEAAAKLLRLRSKLTANPAEQTRPPEFLAMVVGKGSRAYRRSDGVLTIPVAALEP